MSKKVKILKLELKGTLLGIWIPGIGGIYDMKRRRLTLDEDSDDLGLYCTLEEFLDKNGMSGEADPLEIPGVKITVEIPRPPRKKSRG